MQAFVLLSGALGEVVKDCLTIPESLAGLEAARTFQPIQLRMVHMG